MQKSTTNAFFQPDIYILVTAFLLPPPLEFYPLFFVTATELGIVVTLFGLDVGSSPLLALGLVVLHIDVVAGVQGGELVLADDVLELVVGGVDELDGGEPALVLDPGIRAGLEHHLDEGLAEFALGGGLRVDPADRGVEGGVALGAGDGVAFELGLVEEEVYNFVWIARERPG